MDVCDAACSESSALDPQDGRNAVVSMVMLPPILTQRGAVPVLVFLFLSRSALQTGTGKSQFESAQKATTVGANREKFRFDSGGAAECTAILAMVVAKALPCGGIGAGLPLPLAGEGLGWGVSAAGLPGNTEDVPVWREPSPAALGTMLRIARGASASPASGRGEASPRTILVKFTCDDRCVRSDGVAPSPAPSRMQDHLAHGLASREHLQRVRGLCQREGAIDVR